MFDVAGATWTERVVKECEQLRAANAVLYKKLAERDREIERLKISAGEVSPIIRI